VDAHSPELAATPRSPAARQPATRPYGTALLVLLNLGIFLAGPWYLTRWLGLGPLRVAGVPLYLALGADSQAIADGEWYRLITANFLHLDVGHLGTNVAALLLVGWASERRLTTRLLVATYLVTGTSALAAAYALEPCHVWLGASAAVFGLIGARAGCLAADSIRLRRLTAAAGWWAAVVVVALAVETLGADPGADRLGHLWGLAAGTIVGAAAAAPGRRRRALPAAVLVGLALVGTGLAAWRGTTRLVCPA
jgi:membrane associated rhomboid family serine protease